MVVAKKVVYILWRWVVKRNKSDSLGFLAPNLPALPAFGPRFSFCMNAATAFVSIRSEMGPLPHGRAAGGKSMGRVTNSWTYHDHPKQWKRKSSLLDVRFHFSICLGVTIVCLCAILCSGFENDISQFEK